jgi:hypothetical protein
MKILVLLYALDLPIEFEIRRHLLLRIRGLR